jgi:preprotein translocase subunit SecG
MGFIIGLLTVVMVLNCLLLILLVLIQLPKKEAGLGVAFGSSATDALFGAGSGNVLTKMTKYSAGIFFGLAIVLSIMQSNYHRRSGSEFQREVEKQTKQSGGFQLPPPGPAPTTAPASPAGTNLPALPAETPTAPPASTPTTPAAPAAPAPAPATPPTPESPK